MDRPDNTRVFISYARSDGIVFARRLRAWLEEKEIPLFQDLVSLEGGADFLLQIYKTIDQVEFLVLVMTPRAIASDNVRKEWRYARQCGVCVYPVLPPDVNVDFEKLPHWMSSANWYNLGYPEQWTKLLNDLSRSCETPRVPFMVEDLPESFVERPAEFEALVRLLRDSEREEPIAVTAALRGAGGYGKTTLACAICHERDIQEAFDDGILWVTLGENPSDLKLKVLDLVEVLSGERPGYETVEAATSRLAELLADRDILMVLDDAWNTADLAPFLRGGKRCARLITTRNRGVLPAGARSVNVDAMRGSEAVQLLATGLPGVQETQIAELATRLGKWPVLLKLVNGTLRERTEAGENLEEAIAYVNEDLRENGLTAFDEEDARQRERAVAATVTVGLKAIQGDRARFEELAIFHEDVDIPLSTVERLWAHTGGLSRLKVEKLCERLSRLSLLLRFDLATRSIRLHDVMRTYLGDDLVKRAEPAEFHAALLDAWGDPHRLPDDFAWRWVAYHLREAGRAAELRALLMDFSFLRAKLGATDVTSLLADYSVLDSAAQVPIGDEGAVPGEIADEPLRLVQGALQLSAHVLVQDPGQFASQMMGRLLPHQKLPEVRQFAGSVINGAPRPWLRPLYPALHPPGTALLRTLEGHTSSVNSVAVTPDGKRAVSASTDRTLKVWDLETGLALATLQGHSGPVNGVAVTPDGKRAVSASTDRTLKVWDLETGRALAILQGHSGPVNGVAVTPDGKRAVSASDDQMLKVWDLETGRACAIARDHWDDLYGRGYYDSLYGVGQGHNDNVYGVAVTPDGKRAISASRDKRMKVWDLETGWALKTLEGHYRAVHGVAVTADGKRVVSASSDNTIKVWDLTTGRALATLEGHFGGVHGVAVTPDGKRAISASDDQTLKVWDLETARALQTLAGHSSYVRAVAVTPDGKQAVSTSSDNTIKVWDLTMGRALAAFERHSGGVRGVAVTPDRKQAVSASDDQTLKVWDLETGRALQTLEGHSSFVYGVAVAADGKRAVSASWDQTVKVWNLETGRALATLEGHSDYVYGVALTPDGKQAVSASADRTLKVWDLETGRALQTLKGHLSAVLSVAVTADGKRAVSASVDQTLKVWDLRTGQALQTLEGHSRSLKSVAVTPDGKRAVSASVDQTLKVWDLGTGRALQTLQGHSDWVYGVAVTPDGKHAVSASSDKALKVWDLETGTVIATFTCDGATHCCAFADVRRIVAGDQSGRVHFLELVE